MLRVCMTVGSLILFGVLVTGGAASHASDGRFRAFPTVATLKPFC